MRWFVPEFAFVARLARHRLGRERASVGLPVCVGNGDQAILTWRPHVDRRARHQGLLAVAEASVRRLGYGRQRGLPGRIASADRARFEQGHPRILPRAPQIARPIRWGHVAPRLAGSGMTLILLTACASHPINPPGDKPVAVSCIPADFPKAPAVHSPAQLRQVPDGPTLFQMTAADFAILYAWMLKADPVVEGCRVAGS